MSFEQIVTWASAVGILSVGLGFLWKFIKTFAKAVNLVDTHVPVLTTIAEQFKKNGGNSLKDQIDRIENRTDCAKSMAEAAHKEAKEAKDLAIKTNADVVNVLRILTSKPQA